MEINLQVFTENFSVLSISFQIIFCANVHPINPTILPLTPPLPPTRGTNGSDNSLFVFQARLKVHRWFPRILKNRDPLYLSLGWRRFQTQMFYAKREDNFRWLIDWSCDWLIDWSCDWLKLWLIVNQSQLQVRAAVSILLNLNVTFIWKTHSKAYFLD